MTAISSSYSPRLQSQWDLVREQLESDYNAPVGMPSFNTEKGIAGNGRDSLARCGARNSIYTAPMSRAPFFAGTPPDIRQACLMACMGQPV